MKILLDQQLLQAHTHDLDLLALFRLGEEQHRLLLEPDYDPAAQDQPIHAWLHAWPAGLSERLKLILEGGQEREAAELRLNSQLAILPDPQAAPRFAWRHPDDPTRGFRAHLALQDALALLVEPLHIVVENARNDGAFLRALVPDIHRAWFDRAEQLRWLEFTHGGGNGEIKKLADAFDPLPGEPVTPERQARASGRFVAVFDSDAPRRGAPSKTSQDILAACQRHHIPAHRLERRAAESYLPLKALEAWVNETQGGAQEDRQRRLDSFLAFPPEARAFLKLRDHFNDKGIRDLFANHRHTLSWSGDPEVDAELLAIFKLIREHA